MIGSANGRPGFPGGHPNAGYGVPGMSGQAPVMPAANDPAPSAPPPAGPTPVIQIVQPPSGGDSRAVFSSFLPSFQSIAGKVDGFARHLPWFFWIMATLAASWWVRRSGGVKKLFAQVGG